MDQASETSGIRADVPADGRATSLQRFGFRTAAWEGGENVFIDELRITTTYAEALAIPEPSAALLTALGSLALLRRRR